MFCVLADIQNKNGIYTGDKQKDTYYLFLGCRAYYTVISITPCTIPILFIAEMNKPAINVKNNKICGLDCYQR